MEYAVKTMGWQYYNIRRLTNITNRDKLERIKEWIKQNNIGIIHERDVNTLLFEEETDAMAVKLKWME